MEENLENKEVSSPLPSEPQKTGFNKTPLLIAALVILTGILLVVSLSSRKSSPSSGTKQVSVLSASLSMGDQRAASTSGSAEIDVNIDSGKNKVNGVQLEIAYDPKEVKINDIKPGSFFDNPLVISKKVDSEKGVVTLLLGSQINQKGIEGSGTVAVINFTKTTSGDSQLSFNPGTLVTADGGSQSVLSKTASGSISSTTSQ